MIILINRPRKKFWLKNKFVAYKRAFGAIDLSKEHEFKTRLFLQKEIIAKGLQAGHIY